MNNVELARTLSWRENALLEEREKNVFVKPNEQRRACSDIVMARKRTFRGTRKEVYLSTIINLKNECYEKNVFTRKGMWQTVRHALAQ